MIFRRILAVIVTIITLWLIKEIFYIINTDDVEIEGRRAQLTIASISLCIPLLVACFWLWKPKGVNQEDTNP